MAFSKTADHLVFMDQTASDEMWLISASATDPDGNDNNFEVVVHS